MNIQQKIKEINQLSLRGTLGIILLIAGFCGGGLLMVLVNPICMLIGFIIMGIGIYFLRGATYKYKTLYKQVFIENPLNENFDNLHYDWTSGFTKETVERFAICKKGNQFYSEDLIQASYQGVPFEMSDVTVQQHSPSNKHTKTFFKGRILVLDLPDVNIDSVYIATRAFNQIDALVQNNRFQTVNMDSNDFNHKFFVQAINPHDAYYLLTPHFMEHITNLSLRFKNIIIHARGNKLVLALNDINTNSFDSDKLFKKINYQQEIAKINKEINDIKAIITIIRNLDSNYVSNSSDAATKLESGGFIVEHTANAYKYSGEKIL